MKVETEKNARDPRLMRVPRQMLHAWRLELPHPVSGAMLSFEAPPPEDFACLLAALRRAGPKTQSPEAISDR